MKSFLAAATAAFALVTFQPSPANASDWSHDMDDVYENAVEEPHIILPERIVEREDVPPHGRHRAVADREDYDDDDDEDEDDDYVVERRSRHHRHHIYEHDDDEWAAPIVRRHNR